MITIEHLTKRYGDFVAVDDANIEIAAGEAVALWGPNGAGKTTVIRCLLGLASYEGTIRVGGFDAITEAKQARRLMGHVPQELAFYNDLTVMETIHFSAQLKKVDLETAQNTLETVDLALQANKPVGSLSGGMKQRLAIGLALLGEPPILLLDEPTSNLDAGSRDAIVRLLHDLRSPERVLLLTSHHLEEVGLLAHRVVTFESGRIILECESQELGEKLGLQSWLHVRIGRGELADASASLVAQGIKAWPNKQGVLVEVSSQRKGTALKALEDAGFPVLDFEVWR